jgi:hypothetical protein
MSMRRPTQAKIQSGRSGIANEEKRSRTMTNEGEDADMALGMVPKRSLWNGAG